MVNSAILPPIHPGEILREEYLIPLGLTAYSLAKELNVPRTRIERLIAEKTALSVDTALRLGRFFNTTAQFWLNLQSSFDLKTEEAAKAEELNKIPHIVILPNGKWGRETGRTA